MFHSKLKKRVKTLEKALYGLAEHCGTWIELYEDGEVGEGMRFGPGRGGGVKICDAVRAVVNHLGLDIGVKATKESPKKQQTKRSK